MKGETENTSTQTHLRQQHLYAPLWPWSSSPRKKYSKKKNVSQQRHDDDVASSVHSSETWICSIFLRRAVEYVYTFFLLFLKRDFNISFTFPSSPHPSSPQPDPTSSWVREGCPRGHRGLVVASDIIHITSVAQNTTLKRQKKTNG